MELTRRRLLKHAAFTGIASITGGLRAYPGESGASPLNWSTIPILDTHQHLWDLDKFQPPWLQSAPEVLRHTYVTKDYREAIQGLNVVKAVYMEIDVQPDQQQAEAEHAIALCRSPDHLTAAAVISGRPGQAEFREYIDQFAGNPFIKGVRQVLHTPSAPRGLCLQPSFVASIQRLGELGMSFDLCMRPQELADAAELAARCPETRFVLDHCGNGDPKAFLKSQASGDAPPMHDAETWKQDIDRLARLKNVVCKISGIVAHAPQQNWTAEMLAPVVNHCLHDFGPERVMFGSDWPVCQMRTTYRQWVEALWEIVANRPAAELKALFFENAQRFYGFA